MLCSVGTMVVQTVQATLVLPVERTTGLGCIPVGRNVSYECTATDPLNPPVASTVWLGTAFNCPSAIATTNNRIGLAHEQFLTGVTTGVCGGLSAMSTGFSGSNFSSILTLTATDELNGMTVLCTLGGSTTVGNDTIKVRGE